MNIEDSLRAALRPQDPGPDFTAGVMAAVTHAPPRARHARLQLPLALAASVVMTVIGLGLMQQQRVERRMEAARQVVLALEITSVKLNQVQQRLSRPGNEENGS